MDVSREDLKLIIMDLLDAGQFINDEVAGEADNCRVCKQTAVRAGLDIIHQEDCPVGRAYDALGYVFYGFAREA
ncbi:hypothetical protein [Alteromonas lipolytica]|uniref:hypothetical protein n=1 Tax=Alteromonas lipolytica TaxID=1856405 RepID=UPI00111314BA|nr:hypothetical protein [Alteromonas lipolytica]GGF59306.1 hypothetical protein GCM10011338_09470 [Alteromonas lipolytica]